MRILIAVLAALSLAGCATTSNFSSLEEPGDQGASNLIVGDVATVKDSIRQAIRKEHGDASVHESSEGGFRWSHGAGSFQLKIFAGIGVGKNKQKILGFFYTIETISGVAAYDTDYLPPLRRAIDDTLSSSGLKTVKVSLVSKGTIKEQTQAMAREADTCFSDVDNDPALAILHSRISFDDGANPSFAMMTNTSKPTAEEKQAILRWGQSREKCLALENLVTNSIDTPPQLGAARDSLIANQQALIAQLYIGNLTYGEFASKMQAVTNSYRELSARAKADIKKAADEKRDRERQIEATRNSTPIIQAAPPRGPTRCTYGMGEMYCD